MANCRATSLKTALAPTSSKNATHTFLGGVILDTVRQSYDDLLGKPDWQEALRGRMKAQHLEEIRKLFSGAFDTQTGTPSDDD
jgi:hypothetical protein